MRFCSAFLVGIIASIAATLLIGCGNTQADDKAKPTMSIRQTDVIYGRKDGMALTMDVFTPRQNANGAAVLWMVSGGWYSSHDGISDDTPGVLLSRGYTVFAIVHGSQPKYTIPEILPDIQRATRFVRYHAADYGIDPNRIGILGASSGGHLALMQGLMGNAGLAEATDPVERMSSQIQAVACFFPPTDFLNFGKAGNSALTDENLKDFRAPFAFELNDPKRRIDVAAYISPINHVAADNPPILVISGDKDELVPIQQSEIFIARLKAAKIPSELIVEKGGAHGWDGMDKNLSQMCDWFDKYMPKK